MIPNEPRKRAFVILSAAGLTVALAALLAVRVAATVTGGSDLADGEVLVRKGEASPRGLVPPPKSIVLADLPNPYCWGCTWNQTSPLEFQVDLDLLAPLGTDGANAALWFRQFAADGVRFATEGRERFAARKRGITVNGDTWEVLPGDDPLLLEAEPWVDQARCRFYPEVWELRGMDTSIPDLLMMLDLARAWVVRGKLAEDPELARQDFRRAVRLGRLLRQDDVTIIQDLVAIACIRIGAEALYELAREEGDGATMVVTALVLADKDAMRLQTARWLTTFEPALQVDRSDPAGPSLRMSAAELDSIVEATRDLADRRFRIQGLIALRFVKHLGSTAQRKTAVTALAELSQDSDVLVADLAARYRDTTLTDAELEEWIEDWR
jgi:hypothetical protein